MKMKEDKNEKKFIKKEKNPKSGKDYLPKNCAGDDGRLVEVKKAKKNKKVDLVVMNTEKESWVGIGEKEETKKRFVTESLSDADDGSDFNNENDKKHIKKKKKKKKLDYGGNQVEFAQDSVKEVEEKKHRKEKKVKNESTQIKLENVKIDEEEKQFVEKNKLSKKAKMEKKTMLVDSMEMTEGPLKKKKKKKKKTIDEETTETTENKARMNVAENEAKSEIPEGETGEVKRDKKKRGREKGKKEGGNEVVKPQVKESMLNMKKDDSTESVIAVIEEEETEPKKKKRKRKNLKGEEEQPSSLRCEEVEEQNKETLVKAASDTKRRKRKKISMKEETQVDNVSYEHGAKKKIKEKMEDQNESAQLDMDLLSEKCGNTDEIAINQERRPSDQATQPQKTAPPMGFGQWSTAQFGSSDQQQKFLRLMGGFKKGFQLAAGNTGRANMALGKNAQQQLQQGLQGEFERAHSRRLDFSNRGAGLGFTAPSNKKFSIDINACRSVRFDN